MSGFHEYTDYDGLGLADLIQKGEVSPLEVLEAAIEQTEKVNPALNAVVYKMYEEGKRTLEKLPEGGAFRGVPFLIKDLLIGYKGHPTTASSEFLAGYVSDFDANLVKRYKEAGLVTFGKTNAPEFGILGVTEPKFRGPCRNPWSTEKTPGGSSGGAASAVAARMVPLAHGGDGGGSIRIPASACGLVGLKPSRGRNPMGPMGAESWLGYVVEHVLTRSVRDSAAALDATHGSDGGVPYTAPAPQGKFLDAALTAPKKLRIAFTKDSLFGKETHRDCQEAVDKAVKACEEMGHTVEEAIPQFDKRELVQAYIVMVGASVVLELEKAAKMTQQELDPEKFELTTWFLYLAGQKFTAKELVWAIHHTRQAGRSLGRFFENYDLLITSTMAHPPSDIGLMDLSSAEKLILNVMKVVPSEFVLRKALGQMAEEGLERTPNTQLCNQTGVPAISLPLHWNQQNIPIGVQFIAPFGGEERLLQIAGQLEKVLPWSDKKPPIILE